jgi:predicted flap endonuclease-1-like 5' DNA nuclease
VTRERWTAAAEVLREVAVDPDLAKRARSDPSVLPLKAKRRPLWRKYLESAPELGAIALIGPTYAAKLAEAGIADILTLRRRTSTRAGQRKLAAMVGLPASLVAEWAGVVGLAELERVGIPGANLLHDAGVRTCNALAASSDAAALTAELAAYNDLTERMDEAPDKALVAKWIATAAFECPPPPG